MNNTNPEKKTKPIINNGTPAKDYEEFFNQNKLRILPNNNPTKYLKTLTRPRFLGSYHLKVGTDPKYSALNALLKGDLEIKYAKALRNSILNPLTIALIIVAIVFNILWFFLI